MPNISWEQLEAQLLDPRMEEVQWVYVLSNPAYPDCVKIGEVHAKGRMPEDRAKEESSRPGVRDPFKVEGHWPVWDSRAAETMIFNELAELRYRPEREFFNLPTEEALKIISSLLKGHDLVVDSVDLFRHQAFKMMIEDGKHAAAFYQTDEGRLVPAEDRLGRLGMQIEAANFFMFHALGETDGFHLGLDSLDGMFRRQSEIKAEGLEMGEFMLAQIRKHLEKDGEVPNQYLGYLLMRIEREYNLPGLMVLLKKTRNLI